MEEKKPLESKLTHTSKEPEAQLWAQIGTKTYDPPVKQTTSKEKITTTPSTTTTTTTTPPVEPENNGISEEAEMMTGGQDAADPGVGNGKAIAAEEAGGVATTKEAETETTVTQQTEKDPDEQPKEDSTQKLSSSKNAVGDSFDSSKGDTSRSKSGSPERRRNRSRSHSRNRSRSRSPSNRRTFHDYVTNSNNPEDIRSRVFVGHLNTDKCDKTEVEELFKPHGKILGVTIQNGYGFVQYDSEQAVRDAIKMLHGTMFHNMKLGMCGLVLFNWSLCISKCFSFRFFFFFPVVDRPVALRKLEGIIMCGQTNRLK